MFYTYKITNLINKKIYIGKSSDQGKDRWKTHLTIAKGGKEKHPRLFFALHAAICKYGENNFLFETVNQYLTEEEAFAAEMNLIEQFSKQGVLLYNLTAGGEGSTGAKRSKNSKEKMSLAHQQPGYMGGKQKLTVDKVKEIKIMLTANKVKMKEIAQLFLVSFITISNINRGKTWSWVKVDNFTQAKRIPHRILNEEQVKEIKIMLSKHIPYAVVAKSFNVSVGSIQKIKSGETFKDVR
jgi:group I intron endonuclease